MPELPEVQTVVNTLRPGVVGRRLARVVLHRGDVVVPAGVDLVLNLADRKITAIERRAKRIVLSLDDGNRFFIHLGMTGQLTIATVDEPLKKHTHFVADLDDGRQLRFVDPRRFGGIHWLGARVDEANIGPEPLRIRSITLGRQLAKTRRAIKTALLDQKVVAGIGNIYADESLWAAGIHPLTPAHALSPAQVDRLGKAIKRILRRAILAGGSTLRDYVNANGQAGAYQQRHRVYDRAGKPCRHCQTPIERIVLGGRSTHYCPACQK
jgi:formamidopyrimidine-DNA glycosylase